MWNAVWGAKPNERVQPSPDAQRYTVSLRESAEFPTNIRGVVAMFVTSHRGKGSGVFVSFGESHLTGLGAAVKALTS
jgi:hypothetical protein